MNEKTLITFTVEQGSLDWEKEKQDLIAATTAQPFNKNYNSFSGVDFKLFAVKEGIEKCIQELQSISFTMDCEKRTAVGTLLLVAFQDGEELMNQYGPYIDKLLIKAADEYGACATMSFNKVKLKEMSWAAAVDDLMTEFHYTFEAENIEPLRRVSKPDNAS